MPELLVIGLLGIVGIAVGIYILMYSLRPQHIHKPKGEILAGIGAIIFLVGAMSAFSSVFLYITH